MYTLTVILLVGFACAIDIHPGSAVPGGPFPMKPSEIAKAKDLLKGLDMGVDKLNAKNERRENKFRLVAQDIVKASRQVVTGNIYYVSVNMVESSCENTDANESKKLEECPANANALRRVCKFKIWSRVWHPKVEKRLIISGIYC